MPKLSAIIPTPGQGRPLGRCLRSLATQPLHDGDEVIVVGDCFDGPLPEVESLVRGYAAECGGHFRYVAFNGGMHSWGHREINAGIELARGDYLTFNDDDDVWAPGAFDTIRRVAGALPEPRPLLFRFQTHWGAVCWDELCRHSDGSLVPRQDHIGGHCAVFPNLPDRLGRWGDHYQGDFTFIRDTLALWPNKGTEAVWRDEIIAIARPGAPLT